MFEKNIIDQQLSDRLKDLARFRNRLIHIYWDIDNERIHTFIQEDVDDIAKFIDTLVERLQ